MKKTAKTETAATKVDVTRSEQTEPVGSGETQEAPESTVIHSLQTLREDIDRAFEDRKSTRLNSSHIPLPRMPSSA